MEWVDVLLPLVFIGLALTWGKRFIVARRLMLLRFRPARVWLRTCEEASEADAVRVRGAEPDLVSLGFEFQCVIEEDSETEGHPPQWMWIYLHAKENAHAFVSPDPSLSRVELWVVRFVTFAGEASVFVTSTPGQEPLFPQRAGSHWRTESVEGLKGLWEAHKRHMDGQAAPVALQTEELVKRIQAGSDAEFRFREEAGYLRSMPDEPATRHGVLYFRAAWMAAGRAMKGMAAAARTRVTVSGHRPPLLPEEHHARVSAEVALHLRTKEMSERPLFGGTGKLLLLLLSLAAFLFSFGIRMSWETLGIVLAVLTFHEGGHLLGMWMFGYRSLGMLFLPFLGAVAMGNRSHAKPWQEIVVLLMGPLPGLCVAAVLAGLGWFSGADWQSDLLIVLLILNLFNLLPFFPLDGGQLLATGIFARFPSLRAGFTAISGLALVGVGLYLKATALALFGGVFFLRLFKEIRLARIENRLRKQGITPDEDALTAAVYREFDNTALRHLPFSSRYSEAGVLLRRLRQPQGGWGTLLFLIFGYSGAFWFPAVLGLGVYYGKLTADYAAARSAWEQTEVFVLWKEHRDYGNKPSRINTLAELNAISGDIGYSSVKTGGDLAARRRLDDWLAQVEAACAQDAGDLRGNVLGAQMLESRMVSLAFAACDAGEKDDARRCLGLAWTIDRLLRPAGGAITPQCLDALESYDELDPQLDLAIWAHYLPRVDEAERAVRLAETLLFAFVTEEVVRPEIEELGFDSDVRLPLAVRIGSLIAEMQLFKLQARVANMQELAARARELDAEVVAVPIGARANVSDSGPEPSWRLKLELAHAAVACAQSYHAARYIPVDWSYHGVRMIEHAGRRRLVHAVAAVDPMAESDPAMTWRLPADASP